MRPSIKRLFAAAAASAFLFTSSTLFAADAARPTIECLPEETVLMLRVPNGQKLMDEMRAQTKLGRVFLSKERIDNAFKQIKEKKPADYAKVEADLAKYGLKIEDLREIFTGDSGMAISAVAPAAKGAKPVAYGYFWVEPQGDTGKKFYAALQKAIEQDKGENKPVRTDIKIEGVDVMKLTTPTFRTEAAAMEVPENFDKLTDDEREKWANDQAAKRANPKKIKTGETTSFVTLLGNRIIAMSAMPDNSPGAKPVGAEQVQGLFGAFLKSHLASGKPAGFVARMNQTPGLQEALPTGTVAFDGYFDPAVFIKIAATAEDPGKDPKKVIEALGLDTLGPLAFRSALAGTLVKSNFYVSTPGPRKGIVTLLDQPELAPEPQNWAASSLASYIHWSFDLAKAYKLAKDITIQLQGPEAEGNFQMIEAQSTQMLKADVATVLASLGVQHSVGLYTPELPPKPKARADAASKAHLAATGLPVKPFEGEAVAADEGDGDESPMKNQQPFAAVWNLTNQAIWTQVITALTPFAAQPGGPVVPANEQGFTGFRSAPTAPTEGALLTGKNLLIFALGPKVAEQTLSSINTPPQGEASLKQGKAFAKAKTLVKLRPGIFFALAGNEKTGDQFVDAILTALEGALHNNPGVDKSDADTILEFYKAILPKADELKGAFGVGISQGYNTPKGMLLESVSEFPKD